MKVRHFSKFIIVIGGGAAGVFAALAAKEAHPHAEVTILEKTAQLLSKVRLSGGGRCNVTHACFDPKLLVENYPRGRKELLGPFHRFQPRDTMAWFEQRGISLKVEGDGRVFPLSNSSETIITCFMQEAHRLDVKIERESKLEAIERGERDFILKLRGQSPRSVDRVILATGSNKTGWDFAKSLGHTIQPTIPSLFTFNIPNFSLVELSGLTLPVVQLKLEGSSYEQKGPLLITHWGFSGPAALRLSAFAARFLADSHYEASLWVDWLPELSEKEILQFIEQERMTAPNKEIQSIRIFGLPKSLWQLHVQRVGLEGQRLASISKAYLVKLASLLKGDCYEVRGKTTNKEEFVTCGGVTLSEVDFKTMESRICKGLYFCGEILDIDGVTGGFNFQNCWTTGWLAGKS